ncbi:MAG TPA: protein-methionine-sulfoxide reductase catalytic subunit MsrP [Pyrinomonadaceae bacterium]|nr:protein-methionine-sulfoxide reductase catalytic subunit MsrP [Pyrinomonadaceae bacterium]
MADPKINPSEITPESVYLSRRNFIRASLLAGTAAVTGLTYRYFNPQTPATDVAVASESRPERSSSYTEPDDQLNSFEDIANYNNFYEFSTDKRSVAREAENFITRPWTVEVSGLVQKPRTFDIDELLRFEQEERIYRFRCVEAWSMVIPWVGFPLKTLLDQVEPLSGARFVALETLYDSSQMQSSFSAGIDFPYVEGLRLDEAMHPLTILATGLYGKPMPNQNGAPIRLVVPWKYGFKSIKSVVKITLTDTEPPTTWNLAASDEYGFYSNVNPNVDHPRWSQATERRIGEIGRRETLMFNGYAEQVAGLYTGMDLEKNF